MQYAISQTFILILTSLLFWRCSIPITTGWFSNIKPNVHIFLLIEPLVAQHYKLTIQHGGGGKSTLTLKIAAMGRI